MALPPFGHECRQANRIDGFTWSGCTGTATGFGRPCQPSSSTRRCGFARNWLGFQEPVCLGRWRLYPLCRSFAEPQAGHDLVEWGLRLSPGQASPRIRPVGLSRLRRADRRTHRQRANGRSDSARTAARRPSGLDPLFSPSSKTVSISAGVQAPVYRDASDSLYGREHVRFAINFSYLKFSAHNSSH